MRPMLASRFPSPQELWIYFGAAAFVLCLPTLAGWLLIRRTPSLAVFGIVLGLISSALAAFLPITFLLSGGRIWEVLFMSWPLLIPVILGFGPWWWVARAKPPGGSKRE